MIEFKKTFTISNCGQKIPAYKIYKKEIKIGIVEIYGLIDPKIKLSKSLTLTELKQLIQLVEEKKSLQNTLQKV